ncbi:MAG: hypothetical protein Ta2E_01790 [Mycoplasmoidaceae bacterium]|nr:MAG: hypothetical protein Ta2E_01790 [Mycoplasmoidaceae bacterium]
MNKLDNYRVKINAIDKKIVSDLIKRFEIVNKISLYKKINNIPITNTGREQIVLEYVKSFASNNLKPEMIEAIFKEIIKQSKISQK